eukprot:11464601-Alexandrium_andersonii.AAC.1
MHSKELRRARARHQGLPRASGSHGPGNPPKSSKEPLERPGVYARAQRAVQNWGAWQTSATKSFTELRALMAPESPPTSSKEPWSGSRSIG